MTLLLVSCKLTKDTYDSDKLKKIGEQQMIKKLKIGDSIIKMERYFKKVNIVMEKKLELGKCFTKMENCIRLEILIKENKMEYGDFFTKTAIKKELEH